MADTMVVQENTSPTAVIDAPLPVFTGEQMTRALTAYRDLQHALDRSMPDQIMQLDGKAFRKKGYWRALAVAFNLTVELVSEQREIHDTFADGRDNFGYLVTYRALAPNGRIETGDGACFAYEKAKRRGDADPWAELPKQATEHNVRSHAHTRAFNRAVSNLVGFGEVSAEEVTREEADALPRPAVQPPRRQHEPATMPPTGARKISEAQAKRFFAIAKGAGWQNDELQAFLTAEYSLKHSRDMLLSDYEAAVKKVQEGSGA